MAKPMDPLKIMNSLAGAAHQKMQPKQQPDDQDADDMPVPGNKSSKQAAAINEKKKGNAKAPKLPKSSGY